MSLNYQMVQIQCQIFKLILSIPEKYEKLPTNPSIYIYINKINNRLIFKIENGYKLELQIPETRVPDLWLDMSFGPKLPETNIWALDFKCHSFDILECFLQEN